MFSKQNITTTTATLVVSFAISLTIMLVLILSACSQQNWYEGAKQAQTAQCLKEPLSDYEDCNQPTTESYNEYSKNRQEILEENK